MKSLGRWSAGLVAASVVGSSPLVATPAYAAPCPDVEVVFARARSSCPASAPRGPGFRRRAACPSRMGCRSMSTSGTTRRPRFRHRGERRHRCEQPGGDDGENPLRHEDRARRFLAGCGGGGLHHRGRDARGVRPTARYKDGADAALRADNVAAVALFGKPSSGFLQRIYTGAPPINVGSLYTGKTLDLCIPGGSDLLADRR